jgi:hypothetical protein
MITCHQIWLFWRRLRFLWLCGDTRPATICVILSGYLWAFLLVMPGDTVARPTYKHMRQVLATDEMWALAFGIVATLQLWRLFALTTARSRWWDFGLKITAAFLYGFTAVACLTSIAPVPAAMADNIVIALAAWWDMYRWDVARGCGSRVVPSGACPYEERRP